MTFHCHCHAISHYLVSAMLMNDWVWPPVCVPLLNITVTLTFWFHSIKINDRQPETSSGPRRTNLEIIVHQLQLQLATVLLYLSTNEGRKWLILILSPYIMHLIFIYSLKFFGHARTFLGHSRTIISLSRTTQGHPSNFLEEGFSIIQT